MGEVHSRRGHPHEVADGSHDVLLLPPGAFGAATPQNLADDFAKWRAEQVAALQPAPDKAAEEKKEPGVSPAPLRPSNVAVGQLAATTTVADLLRSLSQVDVDDLSPRECQALLRHFQCSYRRLLGF